MKRVILIICSVILFAAVILGALLVYDYCRDRWLDGGREPGGNLASNTDTVEIFLSTDDHCSVVSENPVRVRVGEDACFRVVFEDNYGLESVDAIYSDGKVTVPACKEDMTVKMRSGVLLGFYELSYVLPPSDKGTVTCNKADGVYPENQTVMLSVTEADGQKFLGWSSGAPVLSGGVMVSYSTEYSFKLTENTLLYPNFLEKGYSIIKYNLAGGTLSSDGATDVIYTQFNERLYGCPNLMADTGVFSRDGYTFLEYNTEPDGTGYGINAGGLCEIPDTQILEVYAVWQEWTPVSELILSVTDEGISVDGYIGDSDTVCIPEYVDGKPVVKVSRGAFVNKSFDTLVLPRTLRSMDSGAFVDCKFFDTLYVYDTFTDIPDDAFNGCRKFSRLRLNAGRMPHYARNPESIATRLEHIIMREEYSDKPIILLVGGSSALYGFNSSLIESALDGQYYVLNCGTNAGGCGLLYMEALSSFLRDGDIIVNAPEYGNVQFGQTRLYWRTFRATESCYNLFRYVDFSQYELFFSAMSDFNSDSGARGGTKEGIYDTPNTSLTDKGCDLVGDKPYKNAIFENTVNIHAGLLSDYVVSNTNRIIEIVNSRGIKFYYSTPPIYSHTFKSTEADVQAFVNKVNSEFNCPYISDVHDYMYPYDMFYDSVYHLTSEGRDLRSEQLARDILAQLLKE